VGVGPSAGKSASPTAEGQTRQWTWPLFTRTRWTSRTCEAAAQTQQYIEAYVKAKARTTGAYRYYGEVVNVSEADSASLVYCEDQSKGYDMYLKPKKINKTAVTKNSYVLYSAQLGRREKGAWVVEKLDSQRGSAKCQP
jgi:hypothetical protein